jgi:hypothetical protein
MKTRSVAWLLMLCAVAAILFGGCDQAASSYQPVGQVRNNNIRLGSAKVFNFFWKDPVFESMGITDKTPADHERQMMDEASAIGIDADSLKKAIEVVRGLMSDDILMFPAGIETARVDLRSCYIIVMTWEMKFMIHDIPEGKDLETMPVRWLGHVLVAAVDSKTMEVVVWNRCK